MAVAVVSVATAVAMTAVTAAWMAITVAPAALVVPAELADLVTEVQAHRPRRVVER